MNTTSSQIRGVNERCKVNNRLKMLKNKIKMSLNFYYFQKLGKAAE